MASIIRIKRSQVSGNPNTLAAGELAYSALPDSGSNGGDRLYIGIGTETDGNAANHVVIGGKFFTDAITNATSSNTPNTIVKRDGDGNINVGTITGTISGNASTATTLQTSRNFSASGDATAPNVSFNGSQNVDLVLTLSNSGVTAGIYGSATEIPVLTVDAKGRVTAASTAAISTTLNVAGGTGTGSVALGTQTLTLAAGTGISTVASAQTVTISNTGVTQLSGTSNQVSVSASTGSVTLSLPQNIHTGATPQFAGASLTGALALGSNRITGVADPVDAQDAATKKYVDEVAQGIKAAPAVRVLTATNLDATYSNGTNGVGATLTSNSIGTFPEIDGVSSWSTGNGILVAGQTNAAQNGRYFISQVGNGSTPWILTRCGKCDEATEIPSSYVFVQEGTQYANTGWVAVVDNLTSFTVGTDPIVWTQFSGAGTYLAGLGLNITGNTFDVNVAAAGGIEIVADALQLKSTVAGNGLSYASGVLTVGGTADRITVGSTSVDIASTYAGQTSIVTLGTVTTGTWSANTIAVTRGGTGLTAVATGDLLYGSDTNTISRLAASTNGKVLQINSSGLPVWGDIDGGTY
jgi:hypothetical protein